MVKQTLTRWLKAVFPYLKAGCGLPSWLLPESSLNRTTDAVGDSGLLKVSQPLGLAESVKWLVESEPDPAILSPQAWQDAVKQWPHLPQTGSIIATFYEVADAVMAQFQHIRPKIDPMVICRSMAVLLFAPFVDQGKVLLEELGSVLGTDSSKPAELILSYAESVAREDIARLEKVNECIVKYSAWEEWALALQEEVLRCRYIPRLIAVTPAPSVELASVLALMIKEAQHDELGGDHSEYPGSQVATQ